MYVYDAAGRLLTLLEKMYNSEDVVVLEKQTSYLYDKNGNTIRTQSSYKRPYSRDQFQSTTGHVSGDGATNNMSMLIERSSSEFDGFNRLISQDKTYEGKRIYVSYKYDGTDLRVEKTVKSSENDYKEETTQFLYDRGYVILEMDENGEETVSYTRGINYISKTVNSGANRYYVLNGHGDVVQMTDNAQRVVNRYEYDTFGGTTLSIESEKNAVRYAGEYYDDQTGQYYLRARYYDPSIGRFISEDSYWGEDSNPLSLNRYTYAHNNPIKYVDPSGHAARSQHEIAKEMKEKAQQDLERAKKSGNTAGIDNANKRINGLDKYFDGKKQYDVAKKLQENARQDQKKSKSGSSERKYADKRVEGLTEYIDKNKWMYDDIALEDKNIVNGFIAAKEKWDKGTDHYHASVELYDNFMDAYLRDENSDIKAALLLRMNVLNKVNAITVEEYIADQVNVKSDAENVVETSSSTQVRSKKALSTNEKSDTAVSNSPSNNSIDVELSNVQSNYEDGGSTRSSYDVKMMYYLQERERIDKKIAEGEDEDGVIRFTRVLESDSFYSHRELVVSVELTINPDFDPMEYKSTTYGYGIYMDDVKGHRMVIKAQHDDGEIVLVDTNYVYTDNPDDIIIEMTEVGFLEAVGENGMHYDHLKVLPLLKSVSNLLEAIDIARSMYDTTWEIPVVEGDMKLTINSGTHGASTTLQYYYGLEQHYYFNTITPIGSEDPVRR